MAEANKRKKKVPPQVSALLTPEENVRRMKEEREAYFKSLKEIEELKNKYYQQEPETETLKVVDEEPVVLLSVADVHPGRKIFIEDKQFQMFDSDYLSEKLHYELSFDTVKNLLAEKILAFPKVNSSLCHNLFFLMSIDKEYFVSETCLKMLKRNIKVWVPRLRHILCVLMNWGATLDTLRLTTFEKEKIVGDDNPKVKERKSVEAIGFHDFNYEHIIFYLIVVLKNKIYPLEDILILVKMMIAITMEKSAVLPEIKVLIDVAVNSLENWDNFKVITFSRYLYCDSENIHNQIAIATTVIPNFSKCREVSSCLCFAILRAMITDEVNFCYPNEDLELLELVRTMAQNPGYKDDLYKFYLLIQLINFLVCQRSLEYTNPEVLVSLQNILDTFKVDLVRKHKTLDAELVKGRINYCIAMWRLFQLEKKSEDKHFLLYK